MSALIAPPLPAYLSEILSAEADLELRQVHDAADEWDVSALLWEIRMPLVDQTKVKHLTIDCQNLAGPWKITMCGDSNHYVDEYPDSTPEYAVHIGNLWLRAADICERLNKAATEVGR